MYGIAHWIDQRARTTPSRIALIGEQRELTYSEMSRDVNRIARMMAHKYGLQTGDRVGIMAGNCVEYMLLLFAIAKLGCIAVVLNVRLSRPELEFQIRDSGVKLLVAEHSFLRTAEIILASDYVDRLLWFDALTLTSTDQLHLLASSYASDPFSVENVTGSSPFIICYTSGTTGRPKGAVLTQENMFWNAVNSSLAIDITSYDRVITLLPLFHIGGIGLYAFPTLLAGGAVIVPNRFDPDQTLQLIERHRVTIVMGVPTIHDMLRKSPAFAATDFSSVRWFYSGGAPCPHELIRTFLDRGLVFGQGYGMTETSPSVFLLTKEDYARKIGSIGKPVLFCETRIVDDQGQDVAAGEVGELFVKGPHIMKEYWNFPEATSAAFKDGWLSTGDLVKADEEGFVYIVGRKKEMIISGGENIYPLELEQVIGELAAVDEVAVIGIPDEKWGEVPIAVVASKRGMTLDADTIRKHCLQRLAKYKVPKTIDFVSVLPKNATGKIDKKAIRQHYTDQIHLQGGAAHG